MLVFSSAPCPWALLVDVVSVPTAAVVRNCSHNPLVASVPEAERVATVRAGVTRRIKDLGRSGKPREAVSELAEMARLGVQPDTQAATALVDACARNGKMDMAQSVFEELFGEFLQPDDVTFAVLARGYGECIPPRWVAISGLLNLMDSKYHIKPGAVVYNALLEICAKTKDEDRGREVISRMEASGVQPDEFTLEAIKNRKALRSHLKRTFNL
ncbi:hypothetical protein WJX72_001693 [[Myrmecia] bisecta]|uniref:Pentatricopeptide repeat-containing protein n=1 Tax=[Myrmecia] bisecta TaxID=41462 RepID=A0AAW1PRS0_9CHLO